MQTKPFGKNLFLVAFSRLVSLVSSVFVGLLLPKMFSVTDYGFFKVFTLYAVYTALLHFGFVDGLLLKLAGKEYHSLDKEKMRTYTQFFWAFELLISIIMIVSGAFFASGDYFFIVLMLAINMVFVNITTYYQFISQAVQRFGEYSAKSLIVSLAKLLFVCALFVVYSLDIADISYKVYLIGLNLLDFSMAMWYVGIYKEITFGKGVAIGTLQKDIFDIFKTGIVLTMAYQVSHLVLALDRQFVNILFSTETFAVYSFAYNIVSMISTMISSVSVVLLPVLKNSTKEFIVESYKKSTTIVSIVASGALLCYFPLSSFIDWFLPNYHDSIAYIAIVLPAFLFTAIITVVMFTVAKVLDMSFDFFKDSCVVLVLGLLANAVAYVLFKSPKAISYASLFVMAIWFVISGVRLKVKTGVKTHKEFIYLAGISLSFLVITGLVDKNFAGFLAYLVALVVWTFAFYFRILRESVARIGKNIFHN